MTKVRKDKLKKRCSEFILFEGKIYDIKKSYEYIIMQEAIKGGYANLYLGPQYMYNKKFVRFFEMLCRNGFISRKIWYGLYFSQIHLSKEKKYILIFSEWNLMLNDLKFIPWIKKQYNVKTVLVVRNMIVNKKYPTVRNLSISELKSTFDLVVTDEKSDADLYRLCFSPDPFSIITNRRAKIKFDICFSGRDKGRAQMVSQIAENALDNEISYDFKIMESRAKYSNLQYQGYQSYVEIIKQDMSSNCILEVLQSGQESYTLRFQEAICLGKKLLTNNEKVRNEKYYNPIYIQIFKTVDDIDWNFVKERNIVDYGYQGEYSPIQFLKEIKEKLDRIDKNND